MKSSSNTSTLVRTAWGLSIITLACLLTACGGGGSSNVATTIDISGVAAKGLVKNGVVKAYRISVDGAQSSTPESVTTVTDETGKFTLKGMPAGIPLVIEVSADPAGTTTVVDESDGSDYAPTSGFSLRAALDTTSNTANVTPFSEMAYTRAKTSTGGLSASNIANANTYVADATGVKTTSSDSTPKFDKDGKTPLNDAALKLVAVAKLASTADTSVTECQSKTTVAEKTKCVVDQLATTAMGTLDPAVGLTQKLQTKIDEAKNANTNVETTNIQKPPSTGSHAGVVSPIQQVKDFIKSLRSNVKALKDTDTTEPTLYTELYDIRTDLKTRAMPLNDYINNTINLTSKAYDLLNDAKAGSGLYSRSWYQSMVAVNNIYYGINPIGECSIYQEKELISLSNSPKNSNFVSCHTSPNRNNLYDFGGNGTWKQTVTGITLAPATTDNTYAVYSRTFRRTMVVSGGVYIEDRTKREYLSDANGVVASISFTKNNSGTIDSLAWSGDMAPSYDDAGAVLGKKHTLSLNAEVIELDAHTKKLNLVGNITLVDTSDIVTSKLTFDTGSYSIHSDNKNGQDAMSLKFGLSTPKWSMNGTLAGSKFVSDKNNLNYDPTHVEFSGAVKDAANAEFFSGNIVWDVTNYAGFDCSQPESSTNFAPETLSMKGIVSIPNRPQLILELAGKKTAFDTGSARFVYLQGSDPSVTVTVSRTSGNLFGIYTATNSQGVGMNWKSTDTSTSLMKNDVAVGTLDFRSGRLTFIDGSYEQF